jgi:hypothetical protein
VKIVKICRQEMKITYGFRKTASAAKAIKYQWRNGIAKEKYRRNNNHRKANREKTHESGG